MTVPGDLVGEKGWANDDFKGTSAKYVEVSKKIRGDRYRSEFLVQI